MVDDDFVDRGAVNTEETLKLPVPREAAKPAEPPYRSSTLVKITLSEYQESPHKLLNSVVL